MTLASGLDNPREEACINGEFLPTRVFSFSFFRTILSSTLNKQSFSGLALLLYLRWLFKFFYMGLDL